MSQFYVKKGTERIDHPNRDPEFNRAFAKGQQRLKTMKFESDGQRRDYDRAVAANPNNVPGLPPFFPAERVRSFVQAPDVDEAERRYWTLYWRITNKKDMPVMLKCSSHLCERMTLHYISSERCWCSRCGTQKPYRSTYNTMEVHNAPD